MPRYQWWVYLTLPATGFLVVLLGQTVLREMNIPPSAPHAMEPPCAAPQTKAILPATTITASIPKDPEPSIVQVAEYAPALPSVRPTSPTTVITQPTEPGPPTIASAPSIAPAPPNPLPSSVIPSPAPPAPQSEVTLPARKVEIPHTPEVSLKVPPGKQQPGVTLEWSAPATIRVHQPLLAQIHVKNTATTPAQNVVVRHRPGPNVTYKTSEPQAVNVDGELVWHLGTLAPDQSRRLELHLTPSTRGPLQCHAIVNFSAVAAHQVQVFEPQLTVKVLAPDKVLIGDNVTFLCAIGNGGDGIAEGVKIKAMLPDGVEHARGKVIEFDVGNIAPKEIRTMKLVCRARGQGEQACTVAVSGEGNLSASDACRFEILTPKLNVALNGPKLRYLERHAIYTLKVANPGNAPASQVEVQQRVPAGFKFHQADNGGRFHEGTRLVSWSLGELQPGQAKEVTFDLVPIEIGEHRLTALAQATRGLKSTAEVCTMVEGLSSLAIDLGPLDEPIEVGAETAIKIRLVNSGTKMESNVQVICTIPEQLEFKGAKCSTTLRYRQEGRDLIFDPLPRLAPKGDVSYTIQVRGVGAGYVRVQTRIVADGMKEPLFREQNMRVYTDDVPSAPAPVGVPIAPSVAPRAVAPIAAPVSEPPAGQKMPSPNPSPPSDTPLPRPFPKMETEPMPSTSLPMMEPAAPASFPKIEPVAPASFPKLEPTAPAPMRKLDPTTPAPLPPGGAIPLNAPAPKVGVPVPAAPSRDVPAPNLLPHALPIPKGNG